MTTSFSTGKSGAKFPYYRCYFKEEFGEVKDRIADQHTKLVKMRLEIFNID